MRRLQRTPLASVFQPCLHFHMISGICQSEHAHLQDETWHSFSGCINSGAVLQGKIHSEPCFLVDFVLLACRLRSMGCICLGLDLVAVCSNRLREFHPLICGQLGLFELQGANLLVYFMCTSVPLVVHSISQHYWNCSEICRASSPRMCCLPFLCLPSCTPHSAHPKSTENVCSVFGIFDFKSALLLLINGHWENGCPNVH